MNKFKIIIICSMISIIISSCTTLTEGLSGKKKDGSDVFLVKKKNPLVIPKDYNELPEPVDNDKNTSNSDDELNQNVKLLIEREFKNKNKNSDSQSTNKDLENSIINKIKIK
mgnify:CR=1 FL=1